MQRKYTLLTSAIGIACGFSLFSSFETDKTRSFHPNVAALKAYYSLPNASPVMTQILNDYQYTPNQQVALLALLRIHGEKIETNQSSPLDTHRWLKNVTQHHLLRKGERWDGINQEKEKRLLEAAPQIEQISQLFGMHEYLRPPQSVHQHIAIIPGATEARVKCRLNLLKQSIAEGRQPTKIIVATGFRRLQDSEAPDIKDPNMRTEAHMVEVVLKQSGLNIPYQILATTVKGNIDRSNTVDTAEFLKEDPCFNQTDVIVYIEQPFTRRFELIFKSYLQDRKINVYPFANPMDKKQPKYWIGDEQARRIYFMFPGLDMKYQKQEKESFRFQKRRP